MSDEESTTPNKGGSDGVQVGKAKNGTDEIVHFSDETLKQHHLYIGKTGMGKSSALGRVVHYLMSEKAAGRSDRAIVVIDPSSDLIHNVLCNVPEELIPNVKLVDLDRSDRVPIVNLLDTAIFRDRDETADVIVKASRRLFPKMGPRQQQTLNQAVKSLYEANFHLRREEQYTIFDVPRLLVDEHFRAEVLGEVSDTALVHWWLTTFSELTWRDHHRVTSPVWRCFETYGFLKRARLILGAGVCTPDIRAAIEDGDIVLVSTVSTQVGSAAASLIGAAILGLVDSVVLEQGSRGGRGVSVIVDDMESFPVDYAELMVDCGRAGSNLIVATKELSGIADGNKDRRTIILSNLACLCVFQVTSEDAAELIHELGREALKETDLTEQAPFRCLVRVRE